MTQACPTCGASVDVLRARFVRARGAHVIAYCSAACRDTSAEASLRMQAVAAPEARDAAVAPSKDEAMGAHQAPSARHLSSPAMETAVAADAASARTGDAAHVHRSAAAAEAAVAQPPIAQSAVAATVAARADGYRISDAANREGGSAAVAAGRGSRSKRGRGVNPGNAAAAPSGTGSTRDGKPAAPVHDAVDNLVSGAPEATMEAQNDASRASPRPTALTTPATLPPAPHVAAVRSGGTARPATRAGHPVAAVLLATAVLAGGGWLWHQSRQARGPATAGRAADGRRASASHASHGAGTGSAATPAPRQAHPATRAVREDMPGTPSGVAEVGSAPASVDVMAAQAAARAQLATLLAGDSSRVQRLAAAALARDGDAAALSKLQALLASEASDIGKLEIAYALARGGHPSGKQALYAALASSRRDVKADAARLLARLRDPKAQPVLESLLELSQNRLSAAEQLAWFDSSKAQKALAEIAQNKASNDDDKARAAIALLRWAAPADAIYTRVVALLDDAHFNAAAAQALSARGDSHPTAVLARLLTIDALRVSAARGLRQIFQTQTGADPTQRAAWIAVLLPYLQAEKDTSRISAAEAILLLTSDARVAEFE